MSRSPYITEVQFFVGGLTLLLAGNMMIQLALVDSVGGTAVDPGAFYATGIGVGMVCLGMLIPSILTLKDAVTSRLDLGDAA